MAISATCHYPWIPAFPKFRSAVNKVSSSLCKLVNSSVVQRLLTFTLESPPLTVLFHILFSIIWVPAEHPWLTSSDGTFLKVSSNFSLISHSSARQQWLNEQTESKAPVESQGQLSLARNKKLPVTPGDSGLCR